MEKTLALSEKAMMSERMQEASAASVPAVVPEAYFPDDLLLLDLPSDPSRPPAIAAAGGHQELLFDELLDPSVDSLVGLSEAGGGGGDEEEELEWLSNKDAFPALETSFEILPSHSRSSSGSAAADGPSPVSVLAAAAAASFAVPVRPRSKGFRRRGRVLAGMSPGPARAVTPAARRAAAAAAERRRCRHCGAEETPQWRAGPEGPKTLCNACGVRYKSGRLVPEYRPASSPTFSPAIHSNSHRRILEMRRRKVGSSRRSARAAPPYLLTSPAM